ncbi:MAG: molybdopterin molybdotransferase MoeA [Methanoregula sp.]|jgi:molybdopterin molybdotransferase|nr:molybdopterin molybdotransferase MoeA [Methanoregula sp.]
MSLFLQIVSVSKAIEEVRNLAVRCGEESVPLIDAFHRILAQEVRADGDIPGFTRSVVDGFAVRSADTTGSSDTIPSMLTLLGRVAMGDAGHHLIQPGACIYVPTGGILPEGADAVVMIEHTEQLGEQVLVKKPVAQGENVLLFNEDFSQGQPVVNRGKRLSSQDIGVLAAAGCTVVPVIKKPKIGILSTGNELVPATVRPKAGQVRDVNSYVIAATVRDLGCLPVFYGIVSDEKEALIRVIGKATEECDAVLISGGSSKDDRDMVAVIIAERGRVLVHGIAIAPGKPTIIGKCNGKPVIGLPGHPASAFIVLIAIVRHLIIAMTGETGSTVRTLQAVLDQNIPSSKGREDYVRVAVHDGIATPLFGKSGLLNTLVRSTGVVRVPAESEGLETGTRIEVIAW